MYKTFKLKLFLNLNLDFQYYFINKFKLVHLNSSPIIITPIFVMTSIFHLVQQDLHEI